MHLVSMVWSQFILVRGPRNIFKKTELHMMLTYAQFREHTCNVILRLIQRDGTVNMVMSSEMRLFVF